MIAIKYVARFDGPKSEGLLRWGSKTHGASSGPDGAGTIPVGDYDIEIDGVVENPANDYCGKDGDKKICFFIPVEPQVQVNRGGFGIHPKANAPELFGCLVLSASAARSFWTKWKGTTKANLPTVLKVKAREARSATTVKRQKQPATKRAVAPPNRKASRAKRS
jgi:hypothetical protein